MVLKRRSLRKVESLESSQPIVSQTPYQNPQSGNKLVPILLVLLLISSFFLGTFYTRVKLLEKGTQTVGTTGGGDVAGTAGNTAPPAEPPSTPVDVDVTGAPVLGNKDAKVALVEFTDYQCPFCGRLFSDTFPSIKKEYIDAGKVKYYVRDYPLTQIHPQAQKAAEATHCANDQGKFWVYHDKLFANQQALSLDDLKKYASELGLNTATFNSCLDSGKFADKISKDIQEGSRYGVRGTPATFAGIIEGNTIKGAVQVSGAQPFEAFESEIEAQLKKI